MIGVARPRTTTEVAEVVRWAGEQGLSLAPRGAGSSVTGSAIPGEGALVVDLRALDRVIEIDTVDGEATVQAGLIGGELERQLSEVGWTTWFSPQSLHRSTVGGWVATGASGQFSSRFGAIEDILVALTVVLADGSVARLGTTPRGAVGPALEKLFIGSEGSFGIVTEVTLRIERRTQLSIGPAFAFPTLDGGLDAVRTVVQSGLRPALLRLYDADAAVHLHAVPPGVPVLLTGFAGHASIAAAEERAATETFIAAGANALGSAPAEDWFARRFDFSRIEAILDAPGGFAETIEISGPWRDMPAIHRSMKDALAPLCDEVTGHFSHVYANGTSLYLIMSGRVAGDDEAVRRLERIWSVAMETALDAGAVISHHHGVGAARAPYVARQLGDGGANLLAALKQGLDPNGVFRPGPLGAG